MLKRALSFLIIFSMIASFFTNVFIPEVKAATMNEASFFAKLNYSKYPALIEVKNAVDMGNYTEAKEKLLEYYQQRKRTGKVRAFPVTAAHENIGMANLPLDNILTGPYEFDTQIGMISVTGIGESSAQWYEADITKKVAAELDNQAISVMLFERQKQEYPVIFYSKESRYSPVLEIQTEEGDSYSIIPDNDTYIDSGNQSTVYGNSQLLYVQEQSDRPESAYGVKTKRAYINFPLTQAANKTIVKAILKLRAYVSEDCTTGGKDVHIISVGDTTWSEDSFTWASTNNIGNIYSWQSDPTGPSWEQPNGADSEYLNVTARFWYARPMVWEYKKYLADPEGYPQGRQYGEKLLFLMNAFATKKSYGFNRTLETGERLNRWIDVIDELVDTPVMTPDIFYNLMSFVWGDCNYLNSLDITNGSYWWSNWRIVANAGFFKATEYFPEFTDYTSFRNKVESNVEYTMDLLYNDDMSFTEAGPSYALWCAELFGTCAKMAEQCGNPMSNTFITKLRYATRFALENFYPNGYDTNIVDSNYIDSMDKFRELDKIFYDDVLKAYVSGGKEGNPPYLTSYYPQNNTALMRNSWDPDEAVYIHFSNSKNDGHAHPDSNQVIMYAYGNPLLVDSGRYGYSGSKIYNEVRQAKAHNTIEAVGKELKSHSNAGNRFDYWVSNDVFDFASTMQNGYDGIKHTRNVLFLREGYAIVSDYVEGNSNTQEYRQNWHFLPSSNAVMSGNTAKTNFAGRANITIAAGSAASAEILDGYHSANYGLVANSKYASYSKTGKNVKFDTLLYPTRAGEQADITVSELAAEDLAHGAISIKGEGIDAVYYVKNNDSTDGRIGDSGTTDAKMVYMSKDYSSVIMVDGTYVSDSSGAKMIEGNTKIPSMSVKKNGSTLEIVGDKLLPAAETGAAIKIKMNGITSVMLNGEPVELKTDGEGNIVSVMAFTDNSFVVNGKTYVKAGGAQNLITNGNFTEFGENNELKDWANAADGKEFTAYTKVTDPTYVHGSGNAITNTTSAGGSAATTLRRFIEVTPGKTYYLSYYAYSNSVNSQYSWMSAAVLTSGGPAFGTFNSLTFYNHQVYGGMNSWSNESGPTYVGGTVTRYDDIYAQGMNHKEFIYTVPEGATHLMLSFFAWTPVGNLYLSDFELYEVEQVGGEQVPVTIVFVDEAGNELAESVTASAAEGTIYAYEDAPLRIIKDGKTYKLNYSKSVLGTVVKAGANELKAVYTLDDENANASIITVRFTDQAGNTIADSVQIVLKQGETLTGNMIPYSRTLPGPDERTGYIVSRIDGLNVVGDGQAKTVTVVYALADKEVSRVYASRGATIQVKNGGANHTNKEEYYNRIMADSRTNTNSGTLYGLMGFDNPLSENAQIGEAKITVYTGADNNATTSRSYSLYALEGLGTEWTRDTVTGVEIPSGAQPISMVTLDSQLGAGVIQGVTFDISDYLAANPNSPLNFLIVSDEANYGVFHSENTNYKPELEITLYNSYDRDIEFTFDGTIARVSGEIGEFIMIVAQYDINGKLVKVNETTNTTLTIAKADTAVKATAFLWTDKKQMKPVKPKITVNFQN